MYRVELSEIRNGYRGHKPLEHIVTFVAAAPFLADVKPFIKIFERVLHQYFILVRCLVI